MKKPNIDAKLEILSVLDHLDGPVKPADIKDQLKEDGIYDTRKPHDWNNTLEGLVSQELVQKTLPPGSKRYTYQITERGTKQLGLWRPKNTTKPSEPPKPEKQPAVTETTASRPATKEQAHSHLETMKKALAKNKQKTEYKIQCGSEITTRTTLEQAKATAEHLAKAKNQEAVISEISIKTIVTAKPTISIEFEAA